MRLSRDSTREEAAVSSQQHLTASEAARALGISLDTLRRWDRSGRIRTKRDKANRRLVPAAEVTRLKGRAGAEELSARNRFRGVVRAVEIDGFLARIELDATVPARVVAIITREAAEELDLRPGREAVAIVKSTSVMVER
jgi:molybdopterin-binding protein